MPGYLDTDELSSLACKVVTVFPNNVKHDLPSILANILLFNEKTGALEAIMDGTEITLWRTAAASAIATKYIQSSSKRNVLAIVGAGAQAKIHAVTFQMEFKFDKVHIWNRTYERAENLCKELNSNKSGQYIPFRNLDECINQADVIITATFATTPLIKYEWLKTGVHINAVGAGGTPMELDEATYKSSVVFVDHLSGVEHELQHLSSKGITFRGEVGGIINGTIPRPSDDEITIFQSLGMATEDCAVAKIVYEKYKELQIDGSV
ncbi:hypothetical protein Trydic_g3399 [Trypoxylus dichotomus]